MLCDLGGVRYVPVVSQKNQKEKKIGQKKKGKLLGAFRESRGK